MKFYLLSPNTVPENPHLFPMFIETWKSKGIEITDRISDADLVLFDLHTRLSGYNQSDINWLIQSHVPCATFDEFDKGGMSKYEWPDPLTDQQEDVFLNLLESGKRHVHFCRLLNKSKDYPENVYPYEKAIMYEEPICTPDELFNRPYDICLIANTSPSRKSIAAAIEKDGRFKSIIQIAKPKIPFVNWVNAHRQAKLFVSASAGGYGNERPQNLFSIGGMIQEKTDQLLLHPFAHMDNCLKVSSTPTKTQLDLIFEVVSNKDLLYEIYSNNYQFMKTYYSSEYIANDILEKIKLHCS